MRSVILGTLAALLSISAPESASAAAPPPAPSSDAFTFAMYGAVKGQGGNLFFSGTSLRDALGMAYLGARGQTAKEMAQALSLDPDANKSATDAKTEIADWDKARGKVTLTIANRLWADNSLRLDPAYAQATANAYGSTLERLDIARSPEPSRLTINGWVEKQTHDRIKDLIPRGALNANSRLVITNAVYFDGKWESPFKKEMTQDDAFAGAGKVPTMHQTAHFKLAKADGMTMLEMPYAGSDLVMDVILPDAQDGLPAVEAKLSAAQFASWAKALSRQNVEVSMPKVKFEWGGSVATPLRALGMTRAFGDAADFSGIAAGPDLRISDVVQKSFVAIDEAGTEAAAATAVMIGTTGLEMPVQSVPFKADHPFVFAIRDRAHGRVLFLGRVVKPGA